MYKIGEFSLATGLSVKTLRYYDEIDILNPGYVDPYTGYRYYTDENFSQVRVINELKNCSFSLEEIKFVMQNGLNEEMINAKQADIMSEIDKLYQGYNHLEEVKESLEKEHPKKRDPYGPKVRRLEKKAD